MQQIFKTTCPWTKNQNQNTNTLGAISVKTAETSLLSSNLLGIKHQTNYTYTLYNIYSFDVGVRNVKKQRQEVAYDILNSEGCRELRGCL